MSDVNRQYGFGSVAVDMWGFSEPDKQGSPPARAPLLTHTLHRAHAWRRQGLVVGHTSRGCWQWLLCADWRADEPLEASRLAGSRAACIPALRAYTTADTSDLSHVRSLGLRSLGLHARRRPAVAPPLTAEPAFRASHPTALGDVLARSEKSCLSAESYL